MRTSLSLGTHKGPQRLALQVEEYALRRRIDPETGQRSSSPIRLPVIHVRSAANISGKPPAIASFGPVTRLAIGITGPRQPILGTELAGVIETVGKSVTRFRPGDAVLAFPGGKMGC